MRGKATTRVEPQKPATEMRPEFPSVDPPRPSGAVRDVLQERLDHFAWKWMRLWYTAGEIGPEDFALSNRPRKRGRANRGLQAFRALIKDLRKDGLRVEEEQITPGYFELVVSSSDVKKRFRVEREGLRWVTVSSEPAPDAQAAETEIARASGAFLDQLFSNDDAEIYTLARRADNLAWVGRYAEALAAFDEAVELEPENSRLHLARGAVFHDMERYAEALAAFDEAIRLEPENSRAHGLRACALFELKRFEEALAACDPAIKLEPNFEPLHGVRADVLYRLERFEEALATCDRAIALGWENSQAISTRAAVLYKLERFEEALTTCDRAIELGGENSQAISTRAAILYKLERFEEALTTCDRAIELGENSQALSTRAAILYQLGRFEEALAACDWAIELGWENSKAISTRAAVLYQLGRFEEALAGCDWALELEPDSKFTSLTRDAVLAKLGESNKPDYTKGAPPSQVEDYAAIAERIKEPRNQPGNTGVHGETMGDETAILYAAFDLLSSIYPRERVEKALGDLAAAERETTGRTNEPAHTIAATASFSGTGEMSATPRLVTAKELDKVPPALRVKPHKKYEFEPEELADPERLKAEQSIANARNHKLSRGITLTEEEDARGKMAASFVKQALRRQHRVGGSSQPTAG